MSFPDSPILKPKIKIDQVIKQKLENKTEEESQVIIHCSYTGDLDTDGIRIWKTTFLYAHNSSHKSKLVLAENITLYPTWTIITKGETINFTLIFTGLPKSCKLFDMVEEIPEPGGFAIRNISRNKTDVYYLIIGE